ncbi:hypothetical protein LCGC14_1864920 [marine sediment metagenome]|uniref:Uncharacterized protein n=1 Tax=marine sediment metagenome TaxID=412755 RepID=A0A0F9G6I7_9ZZZZ
MWLVWILLILDTAFLVVVAGFIWAATEELRDIKRNPRHKYWRS